jgi:hypothetical protein
MRLDSLTPVLIEYRYWILIPLSLVPVENSIGAAGRPFADRYALTVHGDERIGGVCRGGDDGSTITGEMSGRDALGTGCLHRVDGYPPRGYAARRSYRWWRPPTCGIATTRPAVGRAIGRGRGASFSSARCVRAAM